MNASTLISTLVSKSDCSVFSPRNLLTASLSILQYKSYPTASICPCCLAPSRLPAPRISKSRMEMRKPEPKSVNSLMAAKRFSATSLSSLSLLYIRKAYAVRLLLPTLPRSWYNCDNPKRSASSIIIVLTLGISSPVSTIVVETKTSISPSTNWNIVRSSSRSFICPLANDTTASGTSLAISLATISIFPTRLYT